MYVGNRQQDAMLAS